MTKPTLAEQIECVMSEASRRRRTYPELVRGKVMTPETAELEIARMMAALGTLQRLAQDLGSSIGV